MRVTTVWGLTLLTFTLYGYCWGGKCSQTYSCRGTCYRRKKYTTGCGWFNWKRCNRYRQEAYSCTKTCTRQVCCPGYTGSTCTSPLCFGSTSCPDGGTCASPDHCICRPGFASPKCLDIDECRAGTSGCKQLCTNTKGSFRCSCRTGYILTSDTKTCIDVNECDKNKGGCQHGCVNEQGTFHCVCNTGYTLNKDGKTCSDINECTSGRSLCAHSCSNTDGSYTCSCRSGYKLGLDKHSCEDVDECAAGTATCGQVCQNTIGSYKCSCNSGYHVTSNGNTCQDINECATNNGGCQQLCTNQPGTYTCSCRQGYKFLHGGQNCTDIDECAAGTSGCDQTCSNSFGSYTCSCTAGYNLGGDGKSCNDIDDCAGVNCQHGGTCIDELRKFTCSCTSGYTGKYCDNDIDECSFLNGGCEDVCSNTDGSFSCSCRGNITLAADGRTCAGQIASDSVFRRNKIARHLLPKGCSMIFLTRCTDGNNIDVYLSSTDDWFSLKTDPTVTYTFGIVFAQVNDMALPIALSGVEVHNTTNDFNIVLGVRGRTKGEGNIRQDKRIPNCVNSNFTTSDIFQFISSNSFVKSLFDQLMPSLPDWAQLSPSKTDVIDTQGLKTDLVYGRDMDHTLWCEGAPVLPGHLYSVFRFDVDFSISLYSNNVSLPKPMKGHKFCLIVDICHSYGGSVFLMVPEESRTFLTQLKVFQNLYNDQQLLIKPRGLGMSVVRGVNVHYKETSMRLWNGDHMFNYPVMDRASVWIGGGAVKNSSSLTIEGNADIYLSVPRPDRLLTAVFVDEWSALVKMKVTASPVLRFKLFGKQYEMTFDQLGTVEVGAYMSIGGVEVQRQWCGATSNPPGVFVSALVQINPFKTVPILQDWGLDSTTTLNAFVTSDPASHITKDMKIDIKQDIVQLKVRIERFEALVKTTIQSFERLLTNTTKMILDDVQNAINDLKISIFGQSSQISTGSIVGIPAALRDIWKQFIKMKNAIQNFFDQTEFFIDVAKSNFTNLIKAETDDIKFRIGVAIDKMAKQVSGAVKDYSGWGVKFTTNFIEVFGLKFFGLDVEVVYSTNALMTCSRFDKVRDLLKGHEAVRMLARGSRHIKLGYFLKVDAGVGIGGAFAVDTKKVILQFNAYANMLGLKATGDLFITNDGLYIYVQGNVWGIFIAQVDISATLGKDWYQLTYKVEGKFAVNARKRRQTQAVTKSFQGSYLDALRKVTNFISNEANKRISQGQQALTQAQEVFTKAQNWLDDKKADVRKANSAFDSAVAGLGHVKDKLEQAKGPFQRAVEKLNNAQRKVDNLCRIRTCRKLCIPGLKCRICHTGGWVKVPYPCCRFTSCMFKIPNPICVAANLLCRGVRLIAYTVLEAAKIFVKAPMVALDVAKAAVSVTQVVVDKSRVVLKLAEGVLDLAKLGLEGAKGALEVAKLGLEGIKLAIGAAAKVLDLVIRYGLQSIIDVRNCGFSLEMSTVDLPVFDVSCEVNAFKLGWTSIGIRINFKNIWQTLWQAAKATIDALMKGLKNIVSGRKRREISFDSSYRIHNLLRKVRETGQEPTESLVNETIRVVNLTQGFESETNDDYENRVILFKEKCNELTNIHDFLSETMDILFEITNETTSFMNEAANTADELDEMNIENIANNMTIENANISSEYAMRDYNLTTAELEAALESAKQKMTKDPLMLHLNSTAEFYKQAIDSEVKSAESVHLINHWTLAMENVTKNYFVDGECSGFRDCVLLAIATLYDMYTEEHVPQVDTIKQAISELDTDLVSLLGNVSSNIVDVHEATLSIRSNLQLIWDLNVFCSEAPTILHPLTNQTVINGSNVTMHCQARANPSPQYWWYKNGEMIPGEFSDVLVLDNVTEADEAVYSCMAGNVVANISSNNAQLQVVEGEDDQKMLKQVCEQHNCSRDHPCLLPHPMSCFKYIVCEHTSNGSYSVQLQTCDFGKMWNPFPLHACSLAESVDCKMADISNTDPCRDAALQSYSSNDGNGRTYWRCSHGRTSPACCAQGSVYDAQNSTCVENATVHQDCPLINDGCRLAAVVGHPSRYRNIDDVNSNVTLACVDGTTFSMSKCACVMKSSRHETTTTSGCTMGAVDGRPTYYRNLAVGGVIMPCAPGTVFSQAACGCDWPQPRPDSQNNGCTMGAVDGRPTYYSNLAAGGVIMPCAPGTVFSQAACACDWPQPEPDSPNNGCSMGAVEGSPTSYRNLAAGGVVMPCAPGTVFSQTSCSCDYL